MNKWKKFLIVLLIPISTFFIAATYQTVTEQFGTSTTGRDTLQVLDGEKDTSRVFVQDKYNNKIATFVLDDPQNTGNNVDDEYNFKIYILQAVRVYNNETRCYLTKSHCADSVIISSITPATAECDTTHFTSQGLFYYSFQMDYSEGVAFVLEGLTGTRSSGNKPKAYLRVGQRKRK